MRKKHADASSEMTESIDSLLRIKQKLEKERSEMKMEIDDLACTADTLNKQRVILEKQNRQAEENAADMQQKLEKSERELADATAAKARQMCEINELKRLVEEKEGVDNTQITNFRWGLYALKCQNIFFYNFMQNFLAVHVVVSVTYFAVKRR